MSIASLYYRWLQVRTAGLSNVPSDGAAILVGNHAGLRVYDFFSLQVALRRFHPARRWVRAPLHIGTEKALFFGHLMIQYAGGVVGHRRNARYLLDKGELVMTYPEGGNSTGKRFRDRDVLCDLQHFGSGWARLALEADVPVIPVGSSGFESAVPTLFRSTTLGRYWGMDNDLYPVSPQSFLTATMPTLAWTLPFPTRCALSFGEPLDIKSLVGDADPKTEEAIGSATAKVHSIIQAHIENARVLRKYDQETITSNECHPAPSERLTG
ncbi:1-acyl-sn-glycerol-3-phosphate acyltransferase [Pseudonocardia parietis]|uniref:1-acyl-sn-glycerol-3-phosphate acyltransferase n=1 Tax=Pseudonocardia parietis TaxID=570936 RepID=UPI001FDAA638|nr:1-acyl-sn-glycerol-3-phosphate acyltransferase [Pseudonocardia parietis]